ncbi:unnamed protein product [Brugia timori]|uniref:Secreted protein n=1 Tax=Brugia timori TaxID=42155 RepID=A0A0R3QVK0_9BILA|nr:unnamed protein product [Brugia timori]
MYVNIAAKNLFSVLIVVNHLHHTQRMIVTYAELIKNKRNCSCSCNYNNSIYNKNNSNVVFIAVKCVKKHSNINYILIFINTVFTH